MDSTAAADDPDVLIRAERLSRHYVRPRQTVRAVDNVDLALRRGEFLAVVGASGSGKSTLLCLLAGLDSPTSGHVVVSGRRLGDLSRRARSEYRARQVGVIFQQFHLLPHHSALRNVEMALHFNGTPHRERRGRARVALERLGLGDRLDHRPIDLSGGEQQRVAIARALVKNPLVLFADEPTGNLDRENSEAILGTLSALHRDGMTVMLVTHDLDAAARVADRIVRMDYGSIVAGAS